MDELTIEAIALARTPASTTAENSFQAAEVGWEVGAHIPQKGQTTSDGVPSSAWRVVGTAVGQVSSLLRDYQRDRAWLQSKERPMYEPPTMGPQRPVATVDLFSGCGGLSLGVWEACRHLGRFHQVELAVDSNHDAMGVFRENLGPVRWSTDDVRKVIPATEAGNDGNDSIELVRQLRDNVDLMVAGPPCQGFSDLNNHTRRNDERNDLYLHVANVARRLMPKAILIENVPGVRYDSDERVRRTIDILQSLGYGVDGTVVDLSKLGVPQTRKRHVILAVQGLTPSLASITANHEVAAIRDVRWAIEDLQDTQANSSLLGPSQLTDENRRRIDYLFDNDLYDLPNFLRPECHQDGQHSYRAMYGRLRWDFPAQTITSGFGSPGQGRYIHPSRKRTINAREAARLQYFPDFFDFSQAPTRRAVARMIGNAVPMKLTYAITIELVKMGVFS